MTNFSQSVESFEILKKIFDLLDDETVIRKVDEPLDRAVQEFQLDVTLPITHSEFNRVIAAFIQHLNEKGIRLPRTLSYQEALAEAVFILNRYYGNDEAQDYDGIVADAVGKSMEGLEMVLEQLSEFVKTQERMKYVNWVFICYVDSLNWEARQNLVISYLKLNEKYLPNDLLHMDPARTLKVFRKLIIDHVSDESFFRQMINPQR